MTLLRAYTRLVSNPLHLSSSPGLGRGVSSSQPGIGRRLHHRSVVFRCCAVSVGNGGFENSRDGGLLAARDGGSPSRVTNSSASNQNHAAQAPIVGSSSDSAARGNSAEETWTMRAESTIERAIFDFRFLTLMAIGGSLVGSLLCFLKGCGFVIESFIAYYHMCLNGRHTGKVILRLVEAVDVYLVGTVMLIFGMGLYGLFISNNIEPNDTQNDRALKNTTLFGMFPLTKRPLWMRITTLDTLKTKLGHVIVMILLVKLFERSKTVHISSAMDLLYYSISIFLSSASLYVLQRLHAS
ncbi:hypothetical protein M758_4G028100 [Ceratodon purpureus]|nr:hypothetical protein M758_4G028100 [Ceratodon purpureus]